MTQGDQLAAQENNDGRGGIDDERRGRLRSQLLRAFRLGFPIFVLLGTSLRPAAGINEVSIWSTTSYYSSGTDAWAEAHSNVNSGLSSIAIHVGPFTCARPYSCNIGYQGTLWRGMGFASNYFADGTDVYVYADGVPCQGNVVGLDEGQFTTVYNKAFAAGNWYFGTEEPIYHAKGILDSAKHSTNLLLYYNRQQILDNIQANTVFYIRTHANVGIFSDSFCPGGLNPCPGQIIWSSDISSRVALKENVYPGIPPYNFAFIDGCHTAESDALAVAFQVGSQAGAQPADRAFVGWIGLMYAVSSAPFSTTLWDRLGSGWSLFGAFNDAKLEIPQSQTPYYYGAYQFQLVSVYLGSGPNKCYGGVSP